jgi:hypothetical protein
MQRGVSVDPPADTFPGLSLDCLGMAQVAARQSADILALQRLKHGLIQRITVTFLNY